MNFFFFYSKDVYTKLGHNLAKTYTYAYIYMSE